MAAALLQNGMQIISIHQQVQKRILAQYLQIGVQGFAQHTLSLHTGEIGQLPPAGWKHSTR